MSATTPPGRGCVGTFSRTKEIGVAQLTAARRMAGVLGVLAIGGLLDVATLAAGHPAPVTAPMARRTGLAPAGPDTTWGRDSAEVARTVERFHQALAQGDSAAALSLLAPDATILESGGSETVAEYRSHHLPADIEFARAVPGTRSPIRVTGRGDAAWAVSTSITSGAFRGRPVNSSGAELMVLTRTADGWRIAAIHWSSRRRTT
jgi:ketosteroid isomerase-like protein